MNITRATTTSAMLLALVVGATPALAASSDQDGRDRRQDRSARVQANNGGNSARSGNNGDRAVARQSAPRQNAAQQYAPRQNDTQQYAPRQNAAQQYVPRQNAAQQYAPRQNAAQQYAPRQNAAQQYAPRQYAGQQYAPRQYDTRQYASRQYDTRRYDTRQYASRQYDIRRYDNRWYSNGGYGYRPYISRSRIRFGLGISIFAGSPYGFRFDYGWAPPYAYRFPMRQGVGYGGMSFLIDPDDAAVYVDGEFIGISRDFDGQPVPLAAGYHEIELQAEGCEPVVFDITVRPGQVIPYRGSLMPIQSYR